ncbi:MAG: hypothetical protein ISR52_07360 [Rhodospirillales bacterium]|nr:hypothetical protein [Rhodospirillales bacterium]
MDNLISGLLAAGIFSAFVLGLAESIGAVPFVIIVVFVVVLMLIDLKQSLADGFRDERERRGKS